MKKSFKIILSLSLLCLQPFFLYPQPIKLAERIPIEENTLMLTGSFVLLEEGVFLFADPRDDNNQFKLISQTGKLIKAWGRRGPGPEEYGGIAFLDYQGKYLAAYDAGKQRVYIFEVSNNNFNKRYEIVAWETNSVIKLYNQSILIEGYVVSPKDEKYIIFKRDFAGKKTEYILPLIYRFGGKSWREYEQTKEEVSGISTKGFADVFNSFFFYVSDARLKIIKMDLNTMKIDTLGYQTENFRSLTMDKKTREELVQIKTGRKIMEDMLDRYSFITGIFADDNLIGIVYVNREKKIQDEKYFVPYYQIYDYSGKLKKEGLLEGYYTMEPLTPLFYQKGKGNLFLLSTTSSDSGLKYTIYKYEIFSSHCP